MGEWIAKAEAGRAKLSIGFAAEFTGQRYIKKRLQTIHASISVSETLEETCTKAIALAKTK